jgi:TRAP-type transport system small permease protein
MLDDERTETEIANAKVAQQSAVLPPAWYMVDRCIVRATEVVLFGIGSLFTVLIALEVFSRYILSYSFMFVGAGARFLLVWFFILGAGPALRYGAHIGFELVIGFVAPRHRRRLVIATQLLGIAFFLEMVWAGL